MAEGVKDEKKSAEAAIVEKPAQGSEQQVKITLDESSIEASYSNFCRVTGTPEEVIIDFALNPNPFARQDQTVKVDKRLVMNQYTAKRLFAALQQTILRHEQNFGVIELNVQRRLSPTAASEQKK
ncbi:MAG: DUF3467 domain-containing protein [Sedimentisphaerales bacterium]|nr:DUF3467 domain-containing protein [Sedimentisphaerales bacterium]